jgi:microcystin-dependent protein
MQRIQDASAAAALPARTSAGLVGYFTDGNPGTGVAATAVQADWLNAVQEEIVAVATATGAPLDSANNAQMLAAILAIAHPVGAGYFWTGNGGALPFRTVIANGQALLRANYAALWAFAQAQGMVAADDADWAANPGKYYHGDGATTFNVPNLTGEFLRVAGGGRAPGTHQGDTMQKITGDFGYVVPHDANGTNWEATGAFQADSTTQGSISGAGAAVQSINFDSSRIARHDGADETRPVNTGYLFLINY